MHYKRCKHAESQAKHQTSSEEAGQRYERRTNG
jgi:hypothetical protein